MANHADFSAQYKHPLWQKKRLEILDNANFQCQECDADKTSLHVHHLNYDDDCNVWEYEDSNFLVLCEKCHENWHHNILVLTRRLRSSLSIRQMLPLYELLYINDRNEEFCIPLSDLAKIAKAYSRASFAMASGKKQPDTKLARKLLRKYLKDLTELAKV